MMAAVESENSAIPLRLAEGGENSMDQLMGLTQLHRVAVQGDVKIVKVGTAPPTHTHAHRYILPRPLTTN